MVLEIIMMKPLRCTKKAEQGLTLLNNQPAPKRMESIYRKEIQLKTTLIHIATVIVIFISIGIWFNRGDYSWLSMLFLLPVALHIINPLINLYRDKHGLLIIDDTGIRLDAGHLSWKKRWSELEEAHQFKWGTKKAALRLCTKNGVYRELTELDRWQWVYGDQATPLADEIEKHLETRTEEQLALNSLPFSSANSTLNLDLGKHAGIAAYSITGLIALSVFVGIYVHRFYTLGTGISYFWPFIFGLLSGSFTLYYLLKHKAHPSGIAIICLIGVIPGVVFTFLLVKAYVIAFGTDQTYTYTLKTKNGGYQHWVVENEPSLDIKRGSPTGTIHTKAEEGATLDLTVRSIEGSTIKLLLPNELKRTRHEK